LPYVIQCQNIGKNLDEFVEELISEFSVDGVEVTGKKKSNGIHLMNIKYINENGGLEISQDNDDVKVSYEIKRDRKEIKKGAMGAVTGAGLGGLIRGVFSSSRKLSDQVSTAVGGAIAGGAYKAYEGYEESQLDRTKFAQLLAKTVKEVENEIHQKYQKITDKKNQSIIEENNEKEEVENLLEELNLGILSLKEELAFADKDEDHLQRVKARLSRAEELYKEAETEMKNNNTSEAKVRATIAKNMLKKAQELYAQA
jgi:outer membrane lipoprotein SlyB